MYVHSESHNILLYLLNISPTEMINYIYLYYGIYTILREHQHTQSDCCTVYYIVYDGLRCIVLSVILVVHYVRCV